MAEHKLASATTSAVSSHPLDDFQQVLATRVLSAMQNALGNHLVNFSDSRDAKAMQIILQRFEKPKHLATGWLVGWLVGWLICS